MHRMHHLPTFWNYKMYPPDQSIHLRFRGRFRSKEKPPPKGGSPADALVLMVLSYVHIAGAAGNLHLGASAAHRPFQFMMAQRALHGNGQIGVNRAGASVHIQIETVARSNCQANGSRACVQAPGTAHTAVGAEIAAAAAGA